MAVSNSIDRFNGVLASKALKVPVKRATNVNQVLSGDPGPIDGWAWSDGDRILLYGQTNPVQNGIWEVNLSSAWRRAPDFDGTRDATESTLITAGRSGSLNPLMYVLTTDNDPIRIGTDALAFQIYFDPDNPAAAGLQAVTDVGNTTTNDIIINPATSYTPAFIISNAGRIELGNTTADGTIEIGSVAPTGMQISANGIVDLFQFTGLDEFRILGTGAPAGAVLVMGERDEIANPLPGPLAAFGTIWIRDDTPNVLVFTDDAGTDWVLNVVDTLQSVTDNGNTTTNNIELVGTNLLLDDAGEVQFGTVAGGEINIRYDAANNELEFYDASATNTGVRVGAGINNFFVNPEQNANAVVTIGEPSTLRGNAQQAIFNMYGEDTGVLHLAQVQNTGALYWHNAPTLPIQFTGTDFLMDTVNARIRGVLPTFLEEKRLFFEDSLGNVHAYIGPQGNRDYELRNLVENTSVRIQSTLSGGSLHTVLEHNQNSSTYLAANAGRDVELRVGTATFIRCDNLGTTEFFYAGSSNVARITNESNGGLLVSQTESGLASTLRRVLTTFDFGQDAEIWFYDYNNNFMGDPTQARFRINNPDPTLVTAIAVDDTTSTERDFGGALSAIQAGTVLQIAQTTDLGVWFSYTATGPATDNTGWWQIPVEYNAHGGTHNGVTRDPFKFSFSNLTSAPAPAAQNVILSATAVFETTTTAPPGNGAVRFNSASLASMSNIYVDDDIAEGWDFGLFAAQIRDGSPFIVASQDDPTLYLRFVAIAAPSDSSGYWTIPVDYIGGTGALPTAGQSIKLQAIDTALVNAGDSSGNSQGLAYWNGTTYVTNAAALGVNVGNPPNNGRLQILSGWNTSIKANAALHIRTGTTQQPIQFVTPDSGVTYFYEHYDSTGVDTYEWGVTSGRIFRIDQNQRMFISSAAAFFIEEKAAAAADSAGSGQIWVNSSDSDLYFTGDDGVDHNLVDPGASAQTITAGWSTGGGGSLTIAANAPLFYTEQVANDTPSAGQGQVWVRSDVPNTLMFTDDAGTDFEIGGSGVATLPAGVDEGELLVWDDTAGEWVRSGTGADVFTWDRATGLLRIGDGATGQFDISVNGNVGSINAGSLSRIDCSVGVFRLGTSNVDLEIFNSVGGKVGTANIGKLYADSLTWPNVLPGWVDPDSQRYGLFNLDQHFFQFTTLTAAADPGSGYIRVNSSDFSTATQLYIDDLNHHGDDEQPFFDRMTAGDILLIRSQERGIWVRYSLTAAPTDNTGWWTVPVSYIDSSSPSTTRWTVNHALEIKHYPAGSAGSVPQTISAGWTTGSGGSLTIAANAPLFYTEQAADDGPAAGQGQVWVRNDTPNTLMFTDDAGTDFVIGGSLAGGIGGSIADNQIAVGAATADDIEGDANLTWNGTVLALGGAGKQLLLNGPETVPGAPTIGFGAGGDTGFYERGADILAVSVGGTERFNWNGNAFEAQLSLGGGILNETVSATNPTLVPRRASTQTGIGANDADELSLIAGSIEMVRLVNAADDYALHNTPILISESAGAVGDIAAYGQLWVRTDVPNTLMFTDDAGNDFAVPKRQIKAKSADETVNNSSTYQADDHLTGFNLEAGKYYRVEALLRITAGATPDMKIDLVFTNATQLGHKFTSTIAPSSSVQAPTAIETEQVINGDTGLRMIQLEGFFQANAATGGTMELQWAQNTATVEDTTIHEGSFMVIEQTEA